MEYNEMDTSKDTPITAENLASGLISLSNRLDVELFSKTKPELDEYWFFAFDYIQSLEYNLYQFHKCLRLYGDMCRRWESHHNGITCVVERVRDEYLMPKIKQFSTDVEGYILDRLVRP